jgi:hypothetical protein
MLHCSLSDEGHKAEPYTSNVTVPGSTGRGLSFRFSSLLVTNPFFLQVLQLSARHWRCTCTAVAAYSALVCYAAIASAAETRTMEPSLHRAIADGLPKSVIEDLLQRAPTNVDSLARCDASDNDPEVT